MSVILILERNSNTLWVTIDGIYISGIENVTGLRTSIFDKQTYIILFKGERVGIVYDVVHIGEEW